MRGYHQMFVFIYFICCRKEIEHLVQLFQYGYMGGEECIIRIYSSSRFVEITGTDKTVPFYFLALFPLNNTYFTVYL